MLAQVVFGRIQARQNYHDLGTSTLEATFDALGPLTWFLRMLEWGKAKPAYKEGKSRSVFSTRDLTKRVDAIVRQTLTNFEVAMAESKPLTTHTAYAPHPDRVKLLKLLKASLEHMLQTRDSKRTVVYGLLLDGCQLEVVYMRRFAGGYVAGKLFDFSWSPHLQPGKDFKESFLQVVQLQVLCNRLYYQPPEVQPSGKDRTLPLLSATTPKKQKRPGGGRSQPGRKKHKGSQSIEQSPGTPSPGSPSPSESCGGVPQFSRDHLEPLSSFYESGWLEYVVGFGGSKLVLKHLPLRHGKKAITNAELRAHLRVINHRLPFVVTLLDAYVSDLQTLVLVFPRLEKPATYKSLKKMRHGFHQLARGLAGLHAAGLAHGDVSTNNFMYDPKSNALVWIDLGFSRFVKSSLHRPGVGTPGH